MTYGWALLLVIVAIGALAFFGVLRFDTVLPEVCILGTGFGCTTFSVHSTGNGADQYISMTVANNLGQDLKLFAVEITKESDTPISHKRSGRFNCCAKFPVVIKSRNASYTNNPSTLPQYTRLAIIRIHHQKNIHNLFWPPPSTRTTPL